MCDAFIQDFGMTTFENFPKRYLKQLNVVELVKPAGDNHSTPGVGRPGVTGL